MLIGLCLRVLCGVAAGLLSQGGARLFVLLCGLVATVGVSAQPSTQAPASGGGLGKRVALIIGNGAYKDAPLKNPTNDAQDMGTKLKSLGFSVTVLTNLDRKRMNDAIREFSQTASGADAALFYFAGHGMQADGRNYLLPVGQIFEDENDVKNDAVDAVQVLERLESASPKVSILILDACRNAPLKRPTRSGTRGLARMEAPSGALVAFATMPGGVSADGDGRNGVYTKHLLRHIGTPDISIEQVFKLVRLDVERETKRSQSPREESSLVSEFFFIPPVNRPGDTPEAKLENESWALCRQATASPPCDGYLSRYPSGRYAALAQERLKELKASAGRPVAAPPVAGQAGHKFEDCQGCPPMVVVGTGSFRGGASPVERTPARDFAIAKAFAIGQREVTAAEWDACVSERGCPEVPDEGWGREKQPAVNVSWADAKAYVAWLSSKTGARYRLPTEAEWEYAARGGSSTPYPWGNQVEYDRANCLQCGAEGFAGRRPKDVATFSPNAFGLYDVIGNVWEWVADCHTAVVKTPAEGMADESLGCTARVLRGGSFTTAAREATVEARRPAQSTTRQRGNGFRVARDL